MNQPQIIIKRPHLKKCTALAAVLKGDWSSPWYIENKRVYRDIRGGKTGSTYGFIVLGCNMQKRHGGCDAEALISVEYIEQLAYQEEAVKAFRDKKAKEKKQDEKDQKLYD